MNFQVFHVNPGKKLKKKDVNNNLSHFMSVFPNKRPSINDVTHLGERGIYQKVTLLHKPGSLLSKMGDQGRGGKGKKSQKMSDIIYRRLLLEFGAKKPSTI